MLRPKPMPAGHCGYAVGPLPRTRLAGVPRISLSLRVPDVGDLSVEDMLLLRQLPLVVGAAQSPGRPAQADLCLPDSRCKGLAATHFCVLMPGRIPMILDAGSVGGTAVNGRWIGRHHAQSHALLRRGWNEVGVGTGAESGRLWLRWEG
ncbi:MAG: hypothetical protein RL434_2549 [Pseudomonadota bacterium]